MNDQPETVRDILAETDNDPTLINENGLIELNEDHIRRLIQAISKGTQEL